MKGTNGFRFYGFQVRKRLSFVLFRKGRGEVVVDDAGCIVEIESARFFWPRKKGVVRMVMTGLVWCGFLYCECEESV